MNIVPTGLLDLLNGQIQYRIPIYQRKYAWNEKDCICLLNDIIAIAKDPQRDQHYVGSVIYKFEDSAITAGSINVNFLIDGQQRLTTLMLILWALGHYAQKMMDPQKYKESDYNLEAIKEDYLANNKRHEKTDLYYKLKPIGEDEKAYNALMKDNPPSDIVKSQIYTNYQAILSHLIETKETPDTIFTGIKKLIIANVSLHRNDNAQLLFETVNSTGKPLKPVDKVRNYILMNAGETLQKDLYEEHWYPMEQRLNVFSDNGTTLNNFFFYYASIISEDKATNDYYNVFKDHFLGIDANAIKKVVEEMDSYSKLFKRWLDSSASSTGTDLLLYHLKITHNDKCIPVVIKVLRNLELGIMTSSDVDEVLKLLESYIIRREMCYLRSNAIGEAFVKILRVADSIDNIKHCIVADLTDKQRMPNDIELKKALKTNAFYGIRSDHEILDRIEKHLNPAYMPDHTKISIEHIMPQTIESSEDLYARTDYTTKEKEDRDWAKDLGNNWKEIHEKYCNTLGNLTLTGYNTYLSNCRFIVKRDMREPASDGVIYGYSTSAIHLSHGLRTLPQWGEKEILDRLDTIFSYIQSIWQYPNVPTTTTLNDLETSYDDEASKREVKNLLLTSPDIEEIKVNRLYKKTDNSEGYMLLASKMYQKGTDERYWFGYRENGFKAIELCAEKYCIFICRGNNLTVLKIPISLLNNLKNSLRKTTDAEGNITHYHIDIRKNFNGHFSLCLSNSNHERYNITNYIVKTI